jgi:hypothetical protein
MSALTDFFERLQGAQYKPKIKTSCAHPVVNSGGGDHNFGARRQTLTPHPLHRSFPGIIQSILRPVNHLPTHTAVQLMEVHRYLSGH